MRSNSESNTTESCDFTEYLKNENQRLKAENKNLKERAENLAYVMSDLSTKVKDLENEKESLVTASKILQDKQRNIDVDDDNKIIRSLENKLIREKTNVTLYSFRHH